MSRNGSIGHAYHLQSPQAILGGGLHRDGVGNSRRCVVAMAGRGMNQDGYEREEIGRPKSRRNGAGQEGKLLQSERDGDVIVNQCWHGPF